MSIVHFPIDTKVSFAFAPRESELVLSRKTIILGVVRHCRQLNFTKTCQRNDYACNCTDYLSFSEPPYDENSAETRLCGQTNVLASKTRVVVVKYVYQANRYNVFNLTYETKSEYHLTPIGNTTDQFQTRINSNAHTFDSCRKPN